MSPEPMIKEVRKWLIDILRSWLTTWEDMSEEEQEDEGLPEELELIVVALEEKRTNLSRDSYEVILFHLWQKYGDNDEKEEGYTYLKVPDADWALLSESLEMDIKSGMIDLDLRNDVEKAFNNVEVL